MANGVKLNVDRLYDSVNLPVEGQDVCLTIRKENVLPLN